MHGFLFTTNYILIHLCPETGKCKVPLCFWCECQVDWKYWNSWTSTTLYCLTTYINVTTVSCIDDESCLSTFSYTTSYTCFCQLVWLTYRFKIINSLMQDVGASSYKQTDWSQTIFRTIRLQQRDNSFRYSLCFLQLQLWLCVGMFCKGMTFCVSYMWIHNLISLIIATTNVWTVTAMSPQLVHVNNCDLLLGHWPHNFHIHFSSHYE
jgi:hypothetical protein